MTDAGAPQPSPGALPSLLYKPAAPTERVIRVAHCPDSDDAFMFYALTEGKVDTGGIRYEHDLAPIEQLNQRALRGELELSAASIHAYAYLADRYALLPHGASMGDGYGPRVIARRAARQADLRGATVAVPGRLTSAALALQLFEPSVHLTVLPFDAIEGAVAGGEVEFGLLIHESQLTYGEGGLHLVADLGEWWLRETGLPLPLGGNIVRRDLGRDTIELAARHLRASVAYALENREAALDHSMQYARGLERSLADRFVGMYVNSWTLDYGERGRAAVRLFLQRGVEAGVIPHPVTVLFADEPAI